MCAETRLSRVCALMLPAAEGGQTRLEARPRAHPSDEPPRLAARGETSSEAARTVMTRATTLLNVRCYAACGQRFTPPLSPDASVS
jgi:hypothetical protein